MRVLIAAIVLTPGSTRGEVFATLYEELSTILEWTERQAVGRLLERQNPPLERRVLLIWLRGHATISNCFFERRHSYLPALCFRR
jgi:hypothetical protein